VDVVVKLAFDSEQRDALRDEVYCRLRSKVLQYVATVLRFFDDSECGPCAIVMLYACGRLRVMVIDFRNSKQCDGEEAKDEECAQLLSS
jgi:hypothetical protein